MAKILKKYGNNITRFISNNKLFVTVVISLLISLSITVAAGYYYVNQTYATFGSPCYECKDIVEITVVTYGYPLSYRNSVEGGVPYGVDNIDKFEPYNFMLDILLLSIITFSSLAIITIIVNRLKSRKIST